MSLLLLKFTVQKQVTVNLPGLWSYFKSPGTTVIQLVLYLYPSCVPEHEVHLYSNIINTKGLHLLLH